MINYHSIPTCSQLTSQEVVNQTTSDRSAVAKLTAALKRPKVVAPLRVGVVGYSAQAFNRVEARRLLADALATLPGPIEIVSGFTAMGIPLIAYQWAAGNGVRTVGVACSKALSGDYPTWDVDELVIVGNKWGDESPSFLSRIDALVRIGGGPQSHRECQIADGMGLPVIERELPSLK